MQTFLVSEFSKIIDRIHKHPAKWRFALLKAVILQILVISDTCLYQIASVWGETKLLRKFESLSKWCLHYHREAENRLQEEEVECRDSQWCRYVWIFSFNWMYQVFLRIGTLFSIYHNHNISRLMCLWHKWIKCISKQTSMNEYL